jgi:hypothetical protein
VLWRCTTSRLLARLFILCFHLHDLQDEMLFYRDMSGESLHHRGYRSAMHRASLNEAAAAGILLLAGWPAVAKQNPGAPGIMSRTLCWQPAHIVLRAGCSQTWDA